MLRFLAVLTSIFFLSINISFSNDKIVFLDMEIVLKKSIFGKNLLSEIDNLNKKNIDELKIREKELKNKEAEIKKKQNILSKEEIDKEIDNLKNQVKIYRKEKDEMVKKLELKRKKNLNIFLTETSPIIQNYMDQNSYQSNNPFHAFGQQFCLDLFETSQKPSVPKRPCQSNAILAMLVHYLPNCVRADRQTTRLK